jgi:hypothetical protein
MTQSTANLLRHLFVLAILASATMIAPAAAAGGALKVDITRYEPYPAEIGKYVDLWVNVKNMGGGTSEDVTIELVPKYPFTLDSSSNAFQSKGGIGIDSSAMYEYRLFVADDAKPGTHEITIRYQGDEGTTWSEKDFEIKVGTDTLDSRGTLKLEAIHTHKHRIPVLDNHRRQGLRHQCAVKRGRTRWIGWGRCYDRFLPGYGRSRTRRLNRYLI